MKKNIRYRKNAVDGSIGIGKIGILNNEIKSYKDKIEKIYNETEFGENIAVDEIELYIIIIESLKTERGKLLDESEGVDESKSINDEKSEVEETIETLLDQINEHKRQIAELDVKYGILLSEDNHLEIDNLKKEIQVKINVTEALRDQIQKKFEKVDPLENAKEIHNLRETWADGSLNAVIMAYLIKTNNFSLFGKEFNKIEYPLVEYRKIIHNYLKDYTDPSYKELRKQIGKTDTKSIENELQFEILSKIFKINIVFFNLNKERTYFSGDDSETIYIKKSSNGQYFPLLDMELTEFPTSAVKWRNYMIDVSDENKDEKANLEKDIWYPFIFKENHKPVENEKILEKKSKIDSDKLLESEKKEFSLWKREYKKITKADGNCLFSATYRCLRDRKMGDCMIKLFGKDIRNEEKSIQNLRNLVADYGVNHIKSSLEDRRLLIADIKRYDITKDTPDLEKYFKNMFSLTSLENATTIEQVQNNIRKDRKYASFLEYSIIQDLLKEICGINLIMLSSNNKYNIHRIITDSKGDRIEKYDINDPRNIYLYNDGDIHYEYFYNDKDGNKKARSLKKSRRKSKSLKKSRRRSRSLKKSRRRKSRSLKKSRRRRSRSLKKI